MKFDWIAAVMIRLWGLGFVCSGITFLIYFIDTLQKAQYNQANGRDGTFYLMTAQWYVVQIVFHVVIGVASFVGWKRILVLLTKGLGRINGFSSEAGEGTLGPQ